MLWAHSPTSLNTCLWYPFLDIPNHKPRKHRSRWVSHTIPWTQYRTYHHLATVHPYSLFSPGFKVECFALDVSRPSQCKIHVPDWLCCSNDSLTVSIQYDTIDPAHVSFALRRCWISVPWSHTRSILNRLLRSLICMSLQSSNCLLLRMLVFLIGMCGCGWSCGGKFLEEKASRVEACVFSLLSSPLILLGCGTHETNMRWV